MTDLVIDDAPGIRNHMVVLPSKGMIARARRSKSIAHHLGVALVIVHQLLADVESRKGG